jgi:hypothetical protein
MSWQYGLIKHQEDWFYVGEIYDGTSHTDMKSYAGLSGESVEEVISVVEMILKDLKDRLLVIEEAK